MPDDNTDYGMFVPTTQVWDVAEIHSTSVNSPEFKELIIRLYQNVNQLSLVINKKDSAIYTDSEFVTGQTFFPNPAYDSTTSTSPEMRQTYRKVINFGALPNTAPKIVAHNIICDANTTFTRIYGTSTQPSTTFVPLPYSSSIPANCIELWVDATNVNITTGADWSAYTVTYIVLEYLKQ
jgi:hypothetical protein